MKTLKQVLMERDGMTSKEADSLILEAKEDLWDRLKDGDDTEDICGEWFGLEPDYLFDILEI